MAENSFKPQVEQAKADIRSIIDSIKELDVAIVNTSKNVRQNLSGAFKISAPDGFNQLMKDLDATMGKLNNTLNQQTTNTGKLATAKRTLKNLSSEEVINQRALAKNADLQATATSKLVGAYDRLNAKRRIAKNNLRNLISEENKNVIAIRKATVAYNKYTARVNKANKATSNFTNNSLGGAVRGFKNLVGAFGIVGGASIFASLVKDVFNITKELESLNFSLKAVTDSEQEFARVQNYLADISQRYGAEIVNVTTRYTKFLAAAKQSNVSMRDTEQIFESVTKASGVLGLKTDELTGVYLALEQMLSKGKVTTEELRRQLGERLPGAFGIMANALNVSVSELDKMLRKGEILSSEALPKFAKELEKAYGIEAVTTIETLVASQNRLSNSWIALVDSFNNSEGKLTKFFKFFIDGFTDILDLLAEFNTSDEDIFSKFLSGLETTAMQEEMANLKVGAIQTGMTLEEFAKVSLSKFRYESKLAANEVALLKGELDALTEDGPSNRGRGAIKAYNAEVKELKQLLEDAQKSAAIAKGKLNAAFQITNPSEANSNPTPTGPKENKISAKEGSLAFFEAQIKLLEEQQQKLATNTKEYENYAEGIKKAKEELEKLKILLGQDSVKSLDIKSSGIDKNPNRFFKDPKDKTTNIDSGQDLNNSDFSLPDFEYIAEKARGLQSELDRLREKSTITGEEMKEIFGEVTETFADLFDIDIGKFDFLFDGLENSVSDWAELSKELIGSVLDASLNKYDLELQAAQRSQDLILENDLATEKQKRIAREKFDREERRIQNERAKAERRNNLIKIAVDTAVGVVKALASSPPPANFVLAGIVGALGLAQAGIVASQPLPKFAEGHLAGTHSGKALINDAKRSNYQEVVERGNGQVEIYKNRNQVIDMKRGDKVHKSTDSFLTHHDISKDILRMSVQGQMEQLKMAEKRDMLTGKIDEMKKEFSQTTKSMMALAKRPNHIHNHITIEKEYDSYNT